MQCEKTQQNALGVFEITKWQVQNWMYSEYVVIYVKIWVFWGNKYGKCNDIWAIQ